MVSMADVTASARRVSAKAASIACPASWARSRCLGSIAEKLAAVLRQLHDQPALRTQLSAARPIVKTVAEDVRDLGARYRELIVAAAGR